MLKFNKFVCVICVIAAVSGCSAVSRVDRSEGAHVVGQIIDPEALRQGSGVVIVPFTAGVHAAASEEFDRVSLLVLRGIQDGLAAGGSSLRTVLQGPETDSTPPDLQITGRIECYETRDRWLRYIGGQRKRRIELRGRVVNQYGNLAAEFSYAAQQPYAQIGEMDFLLAAGRAVGIFLSPGPAE